MKNNIFKVLLTILLFSNYAFSINPTYEVKAKNFIYLSANTLEFDIYIKHTNPAVSIPFEYLMGQYMFNFDLAFANGGTLTYSISTVPIPPPSVLPPYEAPILPLVFDNQLRLATNVPNVGGDSSFFISGTGDGTLVRRMKLQTTACSFVGDLDLHWRTISDGGLYTKIFFYDFSLTNPGVNITSSNSTDYIIDNNLPPLPPLSSIPTLSISNATINGVPIGLTCGSSIVISHDPLHPQTLEFDITATDADLPADNITMTATLPDPDCKMVEFNPALPIGHSHSNIVSHVTVTPNALAGSCAGSLTIFVIDSCSNIDSCKINFDNPLPVELSSFVSTINQRDVTLNWTTVSEQNNSGFDIEKSNVKGQTSNDWRKIAFVQGNGTSSSPGNYEFTDRNLSSGKYIYRLKQIDYNGNFHYYDLQNEVVIGIPEKFSLGQNYPNPFNPVTKINYDIPKDGNVTLKIFDNNGREVKTIVNEFKPAGYYTAEFDGSNLSSGMYFYRIESGNFVNAKKMILLK